MLGCGSWFAKREGKQKTEQKTAPVTLPQSSDQLNRIKDNLAEFCFAPAENNFSTGNNPYYFLYRLVDNGNCTTKNADDLIKDAFLPEMGKHDSLGFIEVGSIDNSKGKKSERYQQYYKGIKVENYIVQFNYSNNRVTSIAGTYYPNLNIDTTGMISKVEAARVVLRFRGVVDSLHEQKIPQMLRFSNFGLLPQYNKIFYSFGFLLGDKPGTYIVNAISGQFHSYVPSDLMHVCYKCNGNNSDIIDCTSLCTTDSVCTFEDYRLLEVPTLYNGCQTIHADSCYLADTVRYRLSPRIVSQTEIAYSPNDTINIFDVSAVLPNGDAYFQEVTFCYTDSIVSVKNAISNSLYYAMQLSKDYFKDKNMDYKSRLEIWAHLPAPNNISAQYSAFYNVFLFGDGDNINFNPFVSPDVVSHEYAHAVLSHVFNINRDSVHAHQPQVKAIHEGVSDIFSVLARRYAYGTTDWTIGNQVVINPVSTLPRDLAHPENTLPSQALYYNDAANHWSPNDADIYNHAGIIVKWFHLISEGGTGANFSTDDITVQPLGINSAEMVLIAGLDTLRALINNVPSYENLCQATTLAANMLFPPIDGVCSPELIAVRDAWQAVGLNCWASIIPPLCTACLSTSPESELCDNHLPYIQSVQITDAATGNTIAHQVWEWNESQTQLCLQTLSPQQSTNLAGGLVLTLTASEPMNSLNFAGFENELGNVISYGYASNLTTSTNNTQWIFAISNILPDLLSEGTIRLRFTGADMAGNPLEAMQNYPPATNLPPCINAADLPYRNPETGMWNNSHSGTDNSFSFEYDCTEFAYNYDITDCSVDENGNYIFLMTIYIYCIPGATVSITYISNLDIPITTTMNDVITPGFQFSGIKNLTITITDPQTGQVVSFNPLEGLECDPLPVGGGSLPDNQDPIFTALPQISDQLTTCAGSQVCIPYEVSYWGVFESGGIVVQINRFDAVQHIFMNSDNLQTGEFCFTPDVAEVGTHHPVLRAYPAEYPYPAATTTNPLTLSVLCCPTGFNHPQELTALYDC
ncbi:hypothetical protein BVG80_14940, partial [Sphingobacteriales bacterium TSM_CSM]